ncbi:recombinase family protein [Vibrio sp. 10N.286.51.E5]|uniref:recombinase family protein n=1 Tax=Vibrio sp. 10N.286.51.E5 TaxID=3229709 RepID=UPI00354FB7FF
MAIIPYARVSSGKQLEGLSMELQGDSSLLEKIAKEHNTIVSHLFYHDEGVSSYKGKNAKEGELARLIADIEKGIIQPNDIIVMRALDRLSRQTLTASERLYNDIVESGVCILTTIDNHIYKKDCVMSSVLKTLSFKTANEESAKKSHLTNKYAQHRIQQFKNGDIPDNGTAYDVGVGKHPFWIQITDRVVQKHDKNWKIARQMFDMALDGAGVGKLLKFTQSVGLDLSYSSVSKMFRSASVYGDLHINHLDSDHHLKGYYPALATLDEYYRVRAIKDKLTKESNGLRKKVSILGGIQKLYCGCCGHSMGIHRNVKQKIEYYTCISRKQYCFQSLRQDIIDTMVLNAVKSHVFNFDATDSTKIDALEIQLSEQKKKHDGMVQRFMMLGDSAGDGALTLISESKATLDSLEQEIEDERNAVANSTIDLSTLQDFKEAVLFYENQQDQLQDWVNGDCDTKQEIRDLLKMIIKRITIDDRHLIKIELMDGEVEYLYLLRRKDGKKNHDRFFVPVHIRNEEEIKQIREHAPELVNFVTERELDSLDLYLEDITNPILTIERARHTRDLEKEFFDLLQCNLYEWKRAYILKHIEATTTQWQDFKDIDVTKYGFTKAELEITTQSYTKQKKTVVYREWDEQAVLELLGCRKVKMLS